MAEHNSKSGESLSKYRNKYRLESTRLQSWDYSWNGYYFITICTRDKQNFFGNIENGQMILNEMGKIAEKFWLEIPEHFLSVKLDEFVIMPNHVHGVLVIEKNNGTLPPVETLQCNVSTHDNNNTETNNHIRNDFFSVISPKPESIPTIIRSYKSICTKTINKMQNEIFFGWQTRFHDHIIRDEKSLNNIRQYIINNPLKWDSDENNLFGN